MIVLVGVLCQEGVVVGSDSTATFSMTPGLATIEHPVRKTFIVGNDLIFAATGAGGLGQRLEWILQSSRQEIADWQQQHHLHIAQHVSRRMIQNMQGTFLNPGQIGALVAFACQNTVHLCEFALADFQPEMKTEDAWFVSMGSGQLITDPFFGLLRRTLFRLTRPTLREGVLTAYWALHNAIQLNTGGINGPVQLATLRRTTPGGPFEARLLSEDEVGEHDDTIQSLEDYLAASRQQLTLRAEKGEPLRETPPPPPQDPANGPAG
jgi:20S proteasome alpha/beta subunit